MYGGDSSPLIDSKIIINNLHTLSRLTQFVCSLHINSSAAFTTLRATLSHDTAACFSLIHICQDSYSYSVNRIHVPNSQRHANSNSSTWKDGFANKQVPHSQLLLLGWWHCRSWEVILVWRVGKWEQRGGQMMPLRIFISQGVQSIAFEWQGS